MPRTSLSSGGAAHDWLTARLFEATRGAHALAAAAVIFVTFILYSGTRLPEILYWAVYLLICESLLGLTMLTLRERPATWLRVYSVLHILACAGWGLIPTWFMPSLSPAFQSTFALVLVAAAVVSQPTISYMPRLYITGMVLMLAPPAVSLMLTLRDADSMISPILGLFMLLSIPLLVMRTLQNFRMYEERATEALSLSSAREALREHQRSLRAEKDRARTANEWDPVTGLRSQRAFLDELEQVRPRQGAAAVCIKIAGFKYVNMAFGHDVGDEVLQEVAARVLRLAGGEPRLVCRTGGGEFIALLQHPPADLERQLPGLCARPCETSRGNVTIDAYQGVYRIEENESAVTAVHTAIHAAGQAKIDGDKAVRTVAAADQDSQRNRSLMRFQLRDALEKQEFHLHYQPQHCLGDRRLTGFEALLRWNSPVFGDVSPGEFIPVAEEAGLIRELGDWVCRHAVAEFCEYFRHHALSLSLNVSLYQLEEEDFVERLADILRVNKLPPARLTLEITESTFMASPGVIRERLTHLRRLGVRIALDDFGTGYSSLSYLAQIPLDDVKIDRVFVQNIARDNVARTLVISLLQICEALGMQPVIEGVEEKRQIEALAEYRDIIIQGFVFARPMNIKSALSYMNQFLQTA
jgi:diguanylate cyclase (GGDEF)-like protein